MPSPPPRLSQPLSTTIGGEDADESGGTGGVCPPGALPTDKVIAAGLPTAANRVLIVSGVVVGLALGFALSQQGVAATALERYPPFGTGTSQWKRGRRWCCGPRVRARTSAPGVPWGVLEGGSRRVGTVHGVRLTDEGARRPVGAGEGEVGSRTCWTPSHLGRTWRAWE